jgi:hypothetical protein
MRFDPGQSREMAREARQTGRRPWLPLLSALLSLGHSKGELVHHSEQPWASVTFSGSRHRVRLAFFGAEAVAAGEALIEALPEHEFAIPGQLVADAAVVAVEHTALPQPRLEVEAELLLLEDF